MRPGSLARSSSRKTALARDLPSMLAANPNAPAKARRVRLACASCGRVAALVDEDPAGARFRDYPGLRLAVSSGHITRRHFQSIFCPEHGRLNARRAVVFPAAVAARDGRVRTLRLPPVSLAT